VNVFDGAIPSRPNRANAVGERPAKKFSMASTRCRGKNPHFVSMMPFVPLDIFG
jgi:hypothetical protein